MQSFLVFRCPATGMKVQATFAAKESEEPEDRSEICETVSCPACARTHLINVTTGKVLGAR